MGATEQANLELGFLIRQNDVPAAMTTNVEATNKFNASTDGLTKSTQGLQTQLEDSIKSMLAQGATVETVSQFYQQYGGDMSAVNAILTQLTAKTSDVTQAMKEGSLAASQQIEFLNLLNTVDQRLVQTTNMVVAGKQQFTQAGKEAYDLAAQENAAVKQNSAVYDSLTDSTDHTTSGYTSMHGAMRETHMMMAMMVADLGLMSLAQGTTNESIKTGTEVMRGMVDTGLMAWLSTGNPAIGLAAGLAAGFFGLAMAASAPTPEVQALDKSLTDLGKKDDTIAGLMQLTGVTEDVAKAAMDLAKTDPAAAEALHHLEEQAKSATPVLQGLGDMIQSDISMLQVFTQSHAGLFPQVENATRLVQVEFYAQSQYNAALVEGKTRTEAYAIQQQILTDGLTQAQIAQKGLTAAVQEDADLQKSIENAAKIGKRGGTLTLEGEMQYGQFAADTAKAQDLVTAASAKAQAQFTADNAARVTAYASYLDSLGQLDRSYREQQAADSFANTQKDIANRQEAARIQRTLREADAQAEQARDDSIVAARQSLTDKLSDLAFQDQQRAEQDAQTRVSYENSASDQILKVRQDLATQIADIETAEGLKLMGAKTELEAETIEYTAGLDVAKQTQRADASMSATDRTLQREMDALAQRSKIQDEAAQHQVAVADRAYDEQNAKADQSFSQATARAAQSNRDQLADYTNRVNAQGEQEKEQARQQKQRYEDGKVDAKSRYDDEINRIAQRDLAAKVGAELAQVNYVRDFIQRMSDLSAEINARTQLSQIPYGPTSGGVAGTYTPMPTVPRLTGMATGGEIFASRPTTLLIGESGEPETATVRRGPNSGGGNGQTIHVANITLPNVTDAQSFLAELYDHSFQ